ncbi:hypothetical protein ACS0TY_001050 [Phlomoides rotata]
MEPSEADSIITRVRHLRENVVELQKEFDQLTLNVKAGSQSVTQKKRVQQAEPPQAFQVPKPGKTNSAYTSFSSKEKGQQAEPSQGVPVIEPEQAFIANASSSSNLEETEHQVSKLDVSEQPDTSGVKEGEINLRPQKGTKRVDTNIACTKSCGWFNHHWECLLKGSEFGNPELFITDVSGKYPRIWTLKGAGPNDIRRWYNFGALASISTVAPSFWEISGQRIPEERRAI